MKKQSVLGSLPGVQVVLFDLGGTLWAPFGEKSGDQVLDFSVAQLIQEIEAVTGVRLCQDSVREKIVINLAGFKPTCLNHGESILDSDSWREVDLYHVISEILHFYCIYTPNESIVCLTDGFADNLSKEYALYSETIDVLSQLKSSGYKMGIVSNTAIPPYIIDRYLAESGILDYIDFKVLSSEVGWRKPHRNIYKEALNRAKVKPENVIFVGDRLLEDVCGPSLMGMHSALIVKESQLTEDLESKQCFIVLNSLNDLVCVDPTTLFH